jgi:hypothetical protein
MSYESDKYTIQQLATVLRSNGFVVRLSKSETSGHYSDAVDGSRVVEFSTYCGLIDVGGMYKPAPGCGSGWQIGLIDAPSCFDAETARRILYTPAPRWANPAPTYTQASQITGLSGSAPDCAGSNSDAPEKTNV